MRFHVFAVLPLILLFSGCASDTDPPVTTTANAGPAPTVAAQPVRLTPTQELAKYCRVCVVDRGEKIEEFLPARLNTKHQGIAYKFCADHCKKAFGANSKRYALKSTASQPAK